VLAKASRLRGPIAAATQHRQSRILRKPRILKRKFTPDENRPAIGLDPARMLAVAAETWVRMGWIVVHHGSNRTVIVEHIVPASE
jgi:hypothetical protein